MGKHINIPDKKLHAGLKKLAKSKGMVLQLMVIGVLRDYFNSELRKNSNIDDKKN